MNIKDVPNWILGLEAEDLQFIKRLILSSGSLKELAKEYNVTYPTIRLRLNKLIKKINTNENSQKDDEFIMLIKQLAIDDNFDLNTAKKLIYEYRRIKNDH